MTGRWSYQQQLQLQTMRSARRQVLQQRATSQQREAITSVHDTGNNDNRKPSRHPPQIMQPQSRAMESTYDDLPIGFDDLDAIDQEDAYIPTFEFACRSSSLSSIQSIVSSRTPPFTRFFLHNGLTITLRTGSVAISRYLLSVGAPIVRHTPDNVLSAPMGQQLSLFELLIQYGWTVNTPGFYGAVLLPRVVGNLPLLHWFLDHGANPNLGEQRQSWDRTGGSDTNSCAALERAAGQGDVAAVRLLLDAGAVIQYGIPLHFAAGARPPGTNLPVDRVMPSKEFDQSRIPVMALLVERGVDINQEEQSRHLVARYAIVHAVRAGAIHRVRWLLEHGADANLEGAYGSAVTYATRMGSEEMKLVIVQMTTTTET